MAIALGVTVPAAACGLFPDLGGLAGDAAAVDASPLDAADATSASDASDASETGDAGDGATKPACIGSAGPSMVVVGSYCIDSTEVTNAEYAAFLGSAPDASLFPPTCTGWKTTFAQSHAPQLGSDDYPAVWLDWCDAYAYCKWAGKRLCARIGGGPLPTGGMNDTNQDEWYVACSDKGAYTYPYGGAFDASICNGPERGAGSVLPSTSMPDCTGGVPGLHQMVGNADEWIDSCKTSSTGPEGGADPCERRSGSWEDPDGGLQTCTFARTGPRSQEDWDIGFRCCSDLAP